MSGVCPPSDYRWKSDTPEHIKVKLCTDYFPIAPHRVLTWCEYKEIKTGKKCCQSYVENGECNRDTCVMVHCDRAATICKLGISASDRAEIKQNRQRAIP